MSQSLASNEKQWQTFYTEADKAAKATSRRLSRKFVNAYAMHWRQSPAAHEIEECKSFSMLHQETLMLLSYFAKRAKGAILELGAYLGAASVTMARSLREPSSAKLITVECGGAHTTHPHHPTDDILRDLKANLKRYHVDSVVNLVEGLTDDKNVVREVEHLLAGRKVDLLFIDADGNIARDMSVYARFLASNCVVVLDDYLVACEGAADKEVSVRNWVSEAVDMGLVTDLGIYPWGTWVGQYNGAQEA